MSTYPKDPDAIKDYAVDWADWMAPGDNINSSSVAVESGDVTIQGTPTLVGTVLTAFVAGGTPGTKARVRFRIGTTQGRSDDRTVELYIRHT